MEETFEDSTFLESYTTENGILAEIYEFGSECGAYIEKDNIIYIYEDLVNEGFPCCSHHYNQKIRFPLLMLPS